MVIKPVSFGKLMEFGTRKLWSIVRNKNIRDSVTGKVTFATIVVSESLSTSIKFE